MKHQWQDITLYKQGEVRIYRCSACELCSNGDVRDPLPDEEGCLGYPKGLRDEFAKAALTGILANSNYSLDVRDVGRLAQWSWDISDATLALRSK